MKETYHLPCNIAQALNIIGDRWTLLIVHEILLGHTTFNEIKKSLDGISSNLLSDRLKYLEETGLITSTLYSVHPPRYRYTLTESGKSLESVFNALILWGRNHLKKCYKKIVHQSCQHEIEIAYYCPHCEKNVDDLAVVNLESNDREPLSS
ncbi:winged helix-turn-helix transcriptional regulator [Bacillus methanolicus]|uniref:Transcriptional regulator, HxlR family protein n=1 Tax=Bacillus methanolicus (strain MGA3 / ATCC 53907) TaxID=796606 RepID=I3E8M8_BACMM|nr:helix-turn-helix domain-containing protein [Bacillus methanolicus]AIE60118.1 transcriptional regulator, HxlR family protein [Bacillus methanolicus MGA3]EIJ82849.1 transcriptional regulator, HxlR family protein [Bacillus methanolicus MGA3]